MAKSAVEEARARFNKKNEGKVSEVKGKFPPTLLLYNKEGKPGAYVSGIIKKSEDVTLGKLKKRAYTLSLIETNARITKTTKNKEGEKEYTEVKVEKGEDVSMFAPTRLDRVLKGVPLGTEVFIEYKGKEQFDTKQGNTVYPHTFDVLAAGVPLGNGAPEGKDTDFD